MGFLQSELARYIEENDFGGFEDALEQAQDIGYNLDEQYGKELGHKTISVKRYRESSSLWLFWGSSSSSLVDSPVMEPY